MTIPTIGFNVETATYKNVEFTAFGMTSYSYSFPLNADDVFLQICAILICTVQMLVERMTYGFVHYGAITMGIVLQSYSWWTPMTGKEWTAHTTSKGVHVMSYITY